MPPLDLNTTATNTPTLISGTGGIYFGAVNIGSGTQTASTAVAPDATTPASGGTSGTDLLLIGVAVVLGLFFFRRNK